METSEVTRDVTDIPLAKEAAALNFTIHELAYTALRVLEERDEAIELLKTTLTLREIGSAGPHKEAIRQFLRRVIRPVVE